MNNLTIAGRIGQDAKPNFTPGGRAVTEFSVAVKVGFGDRETTQWFNCSLWGRDADHHGLTQYLTKGAFVAVSGELTCRAYAGKQGPQASADVRVLNITLGPRAEQERAPAAAQEPQGYPEAPPSDMDDEDIPF